MDSKPAPMVSAGRCGRPSTGQTVSSPLTGTRPRDGAAAGTVGRARRRLLAIAAIALTQLSASWSAAAQDSAVAKESAAAEEARQAADKATALVAAWQPARNRDGIQVFTGNVDQSRFDAVKVTTIIDNVKLNTLVAILRDREACEDWVSRCREAYVVERINERELIAYTRTDLPFPFRDRWLLSRSLWAQDPDTLAVTVHSEAIPRTVQENYSGVRVTDSQTTWWLEPLDDGAVRVTNITHVDPDVPLPAWLTNRLLVQGPYRTMANLVALSSNPRYAGQTVSFIEEPDGQAH